MNIQSLRYFSVIADGGTISRAAERFYITQPALSRSIQRLEEELGCKLFDRGGSTLHLTRRGEAVLPIVKQILCLADELYRVADDYAGGRSSLLSIGCCGIGTAAFYASVESLRRRCLEMRIETPKLSSAADMIGKVLNGEIDCCFSHSGYRYGRDGQLDSIPVQASHMQLVVPHGHPFAAAKQVSVTDLAGQNVLLWHKDMFPDYYDRFYRECCACGVEPRIAGTFGSSQELFSGVASDRGVAAVHSTDVYQPGDAPFSFVDLTAPDGQPFCPSSIALFWNRRNSNPALPLFAALVLEELAARE